MRNAKLIVLATVAMTALGVIGVARAEEKAEKLTGTLIDNMCGEKKKDEAAAAGHNAACAVKCEDSGYQVIVGEKHYKFDAAGNDKAKAYLKDNKDLKVVVEGKVDGEKLAVESIKSAPTEEKK